MTTRSLLAAPVGRRPAREVVVVAPRNRAAVKLVVRLWAAALLGATVYHLFGGASPWPALGALALAPLILFASGSACSVEVSELGVRRRGLLFDRYLPWEEVRAIRWRRQGGVERYLVRGRLGAIVFDSDRRGFGDAARLLAAQAEWRRLSITPG